MRLLLGLEQRRWVSLAQPPLQLEFTQVPNPLTYAAAPRTFSWKDINKYPPSAYRIPAEQSMMSILGNQYVSWASPQNMGEG